MSSSFATILRRFDLRSLGAKLTRQPRRFQRQLALLCLSLAFLCAGCASSPSPRVLPPKPAMPSYEMRAMPLRDAVWSNDGYEVLLGFEIKSEGFPPWQHIVQEIEHISTYQTDDGQSVRTSVTLVEAFELEISWQGDHWRAALPSNQRDRHFESGFLHVADDVRALIVERRVRAYPALVDEADFTSLGFAHLPSNLSGDFRTYVPSNFNRTYQSRHQTCGCVLWDDRDAQKCYYQMRYEWKRDGMARPSANFTLSLPTFERETLAGGLSESRP